MRIMPPKAKISREMIIDAAYEIVRESGEENINARNIAEKLSCSTQPVLYVFKTMDEIRECVYQKADEYHSEYLMQINESEKNPMATIGKNMRKSIELNSIVLLSSVIDYLLSICIIYNDSGMCFKGVIVVMTYRNIGYCIRRGIIMQPQNI